MRNDTELPSNQVRVEAEMQEKRGLVISTKPYTHAFFVQISQLKAADTPGTVERPNNPTTPSAARSTKKTALAPKKSSFNPVKKFKYALSNIFQISEEDDYVYYPKKIPLGGQ
jgi:hypothetical protein